MVKLPFISCLFLAGYTLGQSSSTNATCPNSVRDIRDGGFGSWFNSTGTISVQFDNQDDPWQISVSLTDKRAERVRYGEKRSMQWLSIWVSVPESLVGTEKGNRTNVCVYMMDGNNVNGTATNATERKDSCDGIISDECFEEYETFDRPLLQNGECPPMRKSDNCDRFTTRQTRTTNFSSSICALDELESVDLDDDYLSFSTSLAGQFEPGDDALDSFESYDLQVQRPLPILVVAHYRGNVSAKLACIAPNNLVGESRVPQLQLPEHEDDSGDDSDGDDSDGDDSGAVAMRAGWTGVVVVGVAVLFSAL